MYIYIYVYMYVYIDMYVCMYICMCVYIATMRTWAGGGGSFWKEASLLTLAPHIFKEQVLFFLSVWCFLAKSVWQCQGAAEYGHLGSQGI